MGCGRNFEELAAGPRLEAIVVSGLKVTVLGGRGGSAEVAGSRGVVSVVSEAIERGCCGAVKPAQLY